jgi:hypothetical protein
VIAATDAAQASEAPDRLGVVNVLQVFEVEGTLDDCLAMSTIARALRS